MSRRKVCLAANKKVATATHGAQAVCVLSKEDFDGVLLDLDGVVTETARVHAAAWKRLFDEYLADRSARDGKPQAPFDIHSDYETYVDGKPRYQGVESFLRSRGIELPFGTAEDSPSEETICGLGNRKNEIFHRLLKKDGVAPFPSSIAFIRDLRSHGVKTAVVSSSRNCAAILEAAGIADLFDVRLDGVDATELNLKGKPDPDTYLEAAARLGVAPKRAVVVEDAVSGVQAGHRGGFGCIIGVDRVGHAADLKASGADVVVTQLSQIGVDDALSPLALIDDLPSGVESMDDIVGNARGRRLVFFLDYDGTLTPIVDRPEMAVLSDSMRATLRKLAGQFTVAVISGRDLHDVQHLVRIENIFYAGSHGFRISGPGNWRHESEHGTEFLPILDQAERELRRQTSKITGALVERKHLSVAMHYRLVQERDVGKVEAIVDGVVAAHPELRKSRGKKVFDLQPDIDWNKGKAVLWLLGALGHDTEQVMPLYIGDDVTDEDAFLALRDQGVGIVVKDVNRRTAARYSLEDTAQVQRFLQALTG